MKTEYEQLTTAKKNIAKSLIKYITLSNKLGQHGTQSIALIDGVYEAYNVTNMSSDVLELLMKSLNNWHEQNEELKRMFTPPII